MHVCGSSPESMQKPNPHFSGDILPSLLFPTHCCPPQMDCSKIFLVCRSEPVALSRPHVSSWHSRSTWSSSNLRFQPCHPLLPPHTPASPFWMIHHLWGTPGDLTPPGLSIGCPFYDNEHHPPNPLHTVTSNAASFSRLPSPSSSLLFSCTITLTSSLASGLSPLVHPLQGLSAALVHKPSMAPHWPQEKVLFSQSGVWGPLGSGPSSALPPSLPPPTHTQWSPSPLPSLLSLLQKEFGRKSHQEV